MIAERPFETRAGRRARSADAPLERSDPARNPAAALTRRVLCLRLGRGHRGLAATALTSPGALRRSGLVRDRKAGRWIYYRLVSEKFESVGCFLNVLAPLGRQDPAGLRRGETLRGRLEGVCWCHSRVRRHFARDVGGNDSKVSVINRPSSSGTRAVFQKTIMGKADLTEAGETRSDNPMVVFAVKATPGATAYAAFSATCRNSGIERGSIRSGLTSTSAQLVPRAPKLHALSNSSSGTEGRRSRSLAGSLRTVRNPRRVAGAIEKPGEMLDRARGRPARYAPPSMTALRKLTSAPGLTLEETAVPLPGPTDVIIRVRKAGICGTDGHIFGLGCVGAAPHPSAAHRRPRVHGDGRGGR